MKSTNSYLSIGYHYIRPTKGQDKYSRILGTNVEVFKNHIEMLDKVYKIISPKEANLFSNNDCEISGEKYGMLFTFDDGLSDHYLAAKILHEFNIKAFFFIPSCILIDNEPANPIVIHYCLSLYGISRVLKVYREALEEYSLPFDRYNIEEKNENPWEKINLLKNKIKYSFEYKTSRKIILFIYKKMMIQKIDAMNVMHLNSNQVKEIIQMGHSIGTHSHSHISIASNKLTKKQFDYEIINPKLFFEKKYNISVKALSYPFGKKQDCYIEKNLINKTKEYQLAFTIEKILNTKKTSPFELGRYLPRGDDDSKELKKQLDLITNNK